MEESIQVRRGFCVGEEKEERTLVSEEKDIAGLYC